MDESNFKRARKDIIIKPIMIHKNIRVKKPWGDEYILYQNKNCAAWLLNLKSKHKTSLHCHPKKKTGFILLEGTVEIEMGFYEKIKLKPLSKIMIRPGLFHSTKTISKRDAKIIEIESPVDKNDLVRFKDSYGRQNMPYEGKKNFTKLTKKDLLIQKPVLNKKRNYTYNKIQISIEKTNNNFNLINKKERNIYAIVDGSLISKNNKQVLSPGDIVRVDTINKLSSKFKINKYITIIEIKKSKRKLPK